MLYLIIYHFKVVKELFFSMEPETINLKHYVSVVTQLAFRASDIAKECAENPKLKKYQKGINDPVTQADYKIQTMICRGIRHFFPNIKIIGEQTTQYKGQIELNLQQISLDHYPQDAELNEHALLEQLTVWIDPIDNTSAFINQIFERVTILIGLSQNKLAQIGVVACPYVLDTDKRLYKPQVLLGIVSGKKAYSSFHQNQWTQIHAPEPNTPRKMLFSNRKGSNSTITHLLQKYQAQLYRLDGCGIKLVEIIKGKKDIQLYIKPTTHKWDTCAGQAIILALGGYLTDSQKHKLVYDANNLDTFNRLGYICTFETQLFNNIMEDVSNSFKIIQ